MIYGVITARYVRTPSRAYFIRQEAVIGGTTRGRIYAGEALIARWQRVTLQTEYMSAF